MLFWPTRATVYGSHGKPGLQGTGKSCIGKFRGPGTHGVVKVGVLGVSLLAPTPPLSHTDLVGSSLCSPTEYP